MPDLIDHLGWGVVVLAVPMVTVTICVVLVALAALAARQPETRRHCLRVLGALTRYVTALRGDR
ncbi:hypothetical protein [Micromonospora sp. NPDC004551]|uniref:hypothetical protein n=1 Tax=Micromonospora sp. NPDC004551 TaxID=3154284 RepID=UPI0033ACD74B